MVMKTYIYWLTILFIIILLSLIQVFFSKKDKMWRGFLIPVVYWSCVIPTLCYKCLLTSEIRKNPDYYSAATYFFPGVWFIMIYFIFYYYRKYKEGCK